MFLAETEAALIGIVRSNLSRLFVTFDLLSRPAQDSLLSNLTRDLRTIDTLENDTCNLKFSGNNLFLEPKETFNRRESEI